MWITIVPFNSPHRCCPLTIFVYLFGAFRNYFTWYLWWPWPSFQDHPLFQGQSGWYHSVAPTQFSSSCPLELFVYRQPFSSYCTFYIWWHDLRFKVIRNSKVNHDGAIRQHTLSFLLAANRKFSSIWKCLGIIAPGTFDDPDLSFKVIRNSKVNTDGTIR